MAAKATTKKYDENNLDGVLVQLGDFGKYQLFVLFLLAIPLILVSAMHINYVFTAMNIRHRCEIPGCDPETNQEFKPPWLKNAIPFDEHNEPKPCTRYVSAKNHTTCSCDEFIINIEEKCTSYVYESPDETILHDFNLQCDNNLWLLTLIGSASNIGEFIGTPIMGYVADRLGRKKVLVWGTIMCILAGIARALATSYIWFVMFEFISAFFGGPVFCIGFVMGIELVGPKKRVLSGCIISTYYALGEIWIAILAMYIMSWRWVLIALYTPALICIAYHWILPESVRWLLTQGKHEEAFRVLRKAARVNGKELTEESLKELAAIENPSGGIKESSKPLLKGVHQESSPDGLSKSSKDSSTKKSLSKVRPNQISKESSEKVSKESTREDSDQLLKQVSTDPVKEESDKPKEMSKEHSQKDSDEALKEVSVEPIKGIPDKHSEEIYIEHSHEDSDEGLKEVSVEPIKDIPDKPSEEVFTNDSQEDSEEPIKEVEPLKDLFDKPSKEVSEEHSQEESDEPLKEILVEPVKDASSEPSEGITNEHPQENSDGPIKEVSEESPKDIGDKSFEEHSQEKSDEPSEKVSDEHSQEESDKPLKEIAEEFLKDVDEKPSATEHAQKLSPKPLNEVSEEPFKIVSVETVKEAPHKPPKAVSKEHSHKDSDEHFTIFPKSVRSLLPQSSASGKESSKTPSKKVPEKTIEPLKETSAKSVSKEPSKKISKDSKNEDAYQKVSVEPLKQVRDKSLKQVPKEHSEKDSDGHFTILPKTVKSLLAQGKKDPSTSKTQSATDNVKESETPPQRDSKKSIAPSKDNLAKSVSTKLPKKDLKESTSEHSDQPAKEDPKEHSQGDSEKLLRKVSEEPINEVSDEHSKEASKELSQEDPNESLKEVSVERVKDGSDQPSKEFSNEQSSDAPLTEVLAIPEKQSQEDAEEPFKEVSVEPVKDLSDEPLEEDFDEPLKEVLVVPEKDVSDEPSEVVSQEHLQEDSNETLRESKVEPVKHVSQEPTTGVSKERSEGDYDEPLKEVLVEPLKDVSCEPSKEVNKEHSKDDELHEPLKQADLDSVKNAFEKPSKDHSNIMSRQRSKNISKEPSRKVPKEPSKKVSKEPSMEVPKEPLKEVPKEPLKEVSEDPSKEPSKQISSDPIKKVSTCPPKDASEEPSKQTPVQEEELASSSNYPIMEVLRSKCLLFRLLLCFACWITSTFLFYGLTLNSVMLSGNPKIDFILDAIVEFPGYLVVYFLIDSIGRRYTQCIAFWFTSIACITFVCLETGPQWFRFTSYLLGKVGATLAVSVCYFFTSELFPTSLRQSMMGWCSTVGRLGSMAAPQTPLLAKMWGPLPLILYAVLGFIAGYLTLLFPETSKTELPDTVKEAENLGVKPKSEKSRVAKLWRPVSVFILMSLKYVPRPMAVLIPKSSKFDEPNTKGENKQFARRSRKNSDLTRYNTFNVDR